MQFRRTVHLTCRHLGHQHKLQEHEITGNGSCLKQHRRGPFDPTTAENVSAVLVIVRAS